MIYSYQDKLCDEFINIFCNLGYLFVAILYETQTEKCMLKTVPLFIDTTLYGYIALTDSTISQRSLINNAFSWFPLPSPLLIDHTLLLFGQFSLYLCVSLYTYGNFVGCVFFPSGHKSAIFKMAAKYLENRYSSPPLMHGPAMPSLNACIREVHALLGDAKVVIAK